jgi:hypothetical protein
MDRARPMITAGPGMELTRDKHDTTHGRGDPPRPAGATRPGNLDRGPVAVLPLRGKGPAIPGSRGVLDATDDPKQIAAQIARWRPTGIGIRIPTWAVVLDVDPRSGGDATLAQLIAEHGLLPATLAALTGLGTGASTCGGCDHQGASQGACCPGSTSSVTAGMWSPHRRSTRTRAGCTGGR